jgi:hypothetical protein
VDSEVKELCKHMMEVHDLRLNDHAQRLDKLEQYRASSEVQISSLCEKIASLTKAIWWFIGTIIVGLGGIILSFATWYIQTH